MSNWRILRRGESTNEGPSHGVLSPEHPLYSLLDNTEVFLPFSSEFQSLMLWTSMGQEGWNLKPTQLTVFFCSVSRMGSWKLQSHRVSIIFILDHMGRVCSLLFDRMLLCLLGRGPLLFKVRGFDSFDSKLKKKKMSATHMQATPQRDTCLDGNFWMKCDVQLFVVVEEQNIW